MDQLEPFFSNFALSARVFYSGRLCGTSGDHETEHAGHLHVLRRGTLKVKRAHSRTMIIDQPSVLFYPRPLRHQFRADKQDGADIVCATIEFGAGMLNPLILALPELLVIPLVAMKELAAAVELLFEEAFGKHPGRQTAVDRLAEYFLVLLLRFAMQAQMVQGGVLTGLADRRLARAISAIHKRPEHQWTLAELAHAAGMSRARFAVRFRQTVGATPFDYLMDWRLGIAQGLLKEGHSLKIVAPSVGYASPTAFSRAFTQRIGLSPKEWLGKTGS